MADTTSSSPPASCLEKLKSFSKTQKGIILAAEILFSFITFICYTTSWLRGSYVVAICQMVFAMMFFCIFMMELDKQVQGASLVWNDLFRAVSGALLYITTSIFWLVHSWNVAGFGFAIHMDKGLFTGGVFGLITGLLFVYDTYTICVRIRSTIQHTPAPTDDTP